MIKAVLEAIVRLAEIFVIEGNSSCDDVIIANVIANYYN